MNPPPEAFEPWRPLLFSIAYRMLGSVMDAEDAVQETFVRWQRAAPAEITSLRAYLTTTVSRLALNQLTSARARREEYVGTWLPEPLATGDDPDVALRIETDETLTLAFLVLLESLTPAERAVFLLREVFGFEYAQVAAVLVTNPAHCRQILHRARLQIAARRPRFEASAAECERLARSFAAAVREGDLQSLLDLLAPEVSAVTDGGGQARATQRPVHGAGNVARLILGAVRKFSVPGEHARPSQINGHPGLVVYENGRPTAAISLQVAEGRIQTLYIVTNPAKLHGVAAVERLIAGPEPGPGPSRPHSPGRDGPASPPSCGPW